MARMRVSLFAVVIHDQLGKFRQELNEIPDALVITLPDFRVGNVMATFFDSGAHPCDVQFRTFEAHVPDAHLDSRGERFAEKTGDRAPTESCLNREGRAFGGGSFEEPFALLPGCAICFFQTDARVCGKNAPGCLVRIEVARAFLTKESSAYAALTCAVCSSQHIDARNLNLSSHVCELQLPLPFPIPQATL